MSSILIRLQRISNGSEMDETPCGNSLNVPPSNDTNHALCDLKDIDP